jgi:hypothetical protein
VTWHIVSGKRSSTSSIAAKESQDRYVARKHGEIPEVKLMSIEEAVKVLQ